MASVATTAHERTRKPRGSRRLYLPPVRVPPRVHDDGHLLLWQVRGSAGIRLGDEVRSLRAGQSLWIPAGVEHVVEVHENSVMLPMLFDLAESATTLCSVSVITVDRDLRTLFLALVQAQGSLICPDVNIARQILAIIEERPTPPRDLPMPTSRPAMRVAETLLFNPGDDRGAHELAIGAHSSLRTIERAFKAETGLTLRQWRIRNRMEAAGVLLRSMQNHAAVAHRVGYRDTSAFRRAFKAHFDLTPSAYVLRYGIDVPPPRH